MDAGHIQIIIMSQIKLRKWFISVGDNWKKNIVTWSGYECDWARGKYEWKKKIGKFYLSPMKNKSVRCSCRFSYKHEVWRKYTLRHLSVEAWVYWDIKLNLIGIFIEFWWLYIAFMFTKIYKNHMFCNTNLSSKTC